MIEQTLQLSLHILNASYFLNKFKYLSCSFPLAINLISHGSRQEKEWKYASQDSWDILIKTFKVRNEKSWKVFYSYAQNFCLTQRMPEVFHFTETLHLYIIHHHFITGNLDYHNAFPFVIFALMSFLWYNSYYWTSRTIRTFFSCLSILISSLGRWQGWSSLAVLQCTPICILCFLTGGAIGKKLL